MNKEYSELLYGLRETKSKLTKAVGVALGDGRASMVAVLDALAHDLGRTESEIERELDIIADDVKKVSLAMLFRIRDSGEKGMSRTELLYESWSGGDGEWIKRRDPRLGPALDMLVESGVVVERKVMINGRTSGVPRAVFTAADLAQNS